MEKFYKLLSSTQRSTSPKKKNMDIAAELLRIRNSTRNLDISQLRITSEKDRTKINDNNTSNESNNESLNESMTNESINNDTKDDEDNDTINELISMEENSNKKNYKNTI